MKQYFSEYTIKRKSSAVLYGCLKIFLVFQPFVKLLTFKISKNLSKIDINRAVSSTSGFLLRSSAFETVSLRTCEKIIKTEVKEITYLLGQPGQPSSLKKGSSECAQSVV